MPKKRGFTPEKYQSEINMMLKVEPFMSTAEICKKMNMGYETALKYLKYLYERQTVKLKMVGNRRFWYK